MNKTFVTNQVRNQLFADIKSEGFEYIKSKERIIRKYSTGFDVIYVSVVDYNPLFQIEFSIAVRINKVEEIVNLFLDERFTNPQFHPLSITMATSYAVLSGAEENYIEITTEEELKKAINELTAIIREKGFRFFDENMDIEKANLFKKNRILEDTMGGAHVLRNLMQSLTLMKLCNDPDFDRLSMVYKKMLVPWAGREKESYEVLDNLINYLRELKLPTPKLYQTEDAEFSSLMVAECFNPDYANKF